MVWEKPSRCFHDEKGARWRVQCNAETKICLYTPESELDSDGNRLRALERMPFCSEEGSFDLSRFKEDGYTLVQGLPPAPFGWYRDRLGKVFQYNFDLHRRVFLGGGWSPDFHGGKQDTKRAMIEFGLLEWQGYDSSEQNPTRHRLRILEGDIRFAPLWATGYLLRYDFSTKRRDPFLRVTTFFGEPQRYDIYANFGLFLEIIGLETRETPQADIQLWKYGTANITFEPWLSKDLYSFFRLRSGALVDRTNFSKTPYVNRTSFTPNFAADLDWTIDQNGFHHITSFVSMEFPYVINPQPGQLTRAKRFRAELGYEVIALSLNDQPLSLRVVTSATRRDDLPGISNWIYSATAGLRFSLWAPARI